MARINPLYDSFAYGEVTPKLWGRLDTKPHKQGLARCYNMIPDARGAVYARPGSKFLYKFTGITNAKLFMLNTYDSLYYFVFTHEEMHVLDATGKLLVTKTSPFADSHLASLRGFAVPGSDDVWLLHSEVEPQMFVLGLWDITPISFVAPPDWWGADNYPSTCTFYQGRAWLAGTNKNPEVFIASKSGNYYDLTQGANDDDGLMFAINKKGLIKWIEGGKTLLIGTENREFVIESVGPIITPNDVQIVQQSAHGSANIDSIAIGNEQVFISADRKRVRSMTYKWTEAGWFAVDLAYAADHLARRGIADIAFTRNPDPILWMITEQGQLIGCSYLRMDSGSENLIIGWHQHNIGRGIIDIAAADYQGISNLGVLMSVEDGLELLCISSRNLYVLDRFVEYDGPPTTEIGGLDHLEGYEVYAYTDSFGILKRTVEDGKIIVPEVTHAVVGLTYTKEIITLPLAFFSADYGAIVMQTKRWNKIYVRIYESYPPIINGNYAPGVDPDSVNIVQPPVTEDIMVVNRGWDSMTQLDIYQNLPVPLTILNISGEAAVEQV